MRALRSLSIASVAVVSGAALVGFGAAANASAVLPAGCVSAAPTVSCTFTGDGSFTVPSFVSSLTVRAVGGDGAGPSSGGGAGADLVTTLSVGGAGVVTAGESLSVLVGGNASGATAGAHGGGTGGFGGGGATELDGAPGPSQRLVVAGGGGGDGTIGSGVGSALAGGSGGNAATDGDGTAGHDYVVDAVIVNTGGTGGASGAHGGAHGAGGSGPDPFIDYGSNGTNGASNGAGGNGGGAAGSSTTGGGGGGGGAGYVGGGGGGGGGEFTGSGGGGAGSSFTAGSVSSLTAGDGSPRLVITYANPVTARLASAGHATQLSRSIPLAWSGTDLAGSIASYDVRYEKAAWNGSFGPQTTWRSATSATHATFTGQPGLEYCFSVRAHDHAGYTSAWTAQRCAALPLDDRSLTRSTGWTSLTGKHFYLDTATATKHSGETLMRSGAIAGRAVLVVEAGPGYGRITVAYNGTIERHISLAGATSTYRVLIDLPSLTHRSTIVIRTTQSDTVRIDGLLLARR